MDVNSNLFPIRTVVRKNPSSISTGIHFWQNFIYHAAELWISIDIQVDRRSDIAI
jgi:hypothetical protein